MSSFRRERGVILLVVLWICALLTVLLAAFSLAVRVDRTVASGVVEQVRGRAAAEAVLNYLAAVRLADSEVWQAMPGEVFILPIDDVRVRFRLLPESAFLNLNTATQEQIAQVFSGLGLSSADVLASQVVERRVGGSTGAASDAIMPQPWYAVDELIVLGGGLAGVTNLHELFTVDGQHEGVNTAFASSRLLALLGLSAEVTDAVVEEPIYRIQLELGQRQGVRKIEVTAAFDGEGQGYRLHRWNLYNAHFNLD